jgi:hypothetical protein
MFSELVCCSCDSSSIPSVNSDVYKLEVIILLLSPQDGWLDEPRDLFFPPRLCRLFFFLVVVSFCSSFNCSA